MQYAYYKLRLEVER